MVNGEFDWHGSRTEVDHCQGECSTLHTGQSSFKPSKLTGALEDSLGTAPDMVRNEKWALRSDVPCRKPTGRLKHSTQERRRAEEEHRTGCTMYSDDEIHMHMPNAGSCRVHLSRRLAVGCGQDLNSCGGGRWEEEEEERTP